MHQPHPHPPTGARTAPAPPPAYAQPRSPGRPRQRGRGRPTLFSADTASAIHHAIRVAGLTPSAAARSCHVSPATLTRWKKEVPNFARYLELARAEFELSAFRKNERIMGRKGRPDFRSLRKLLQRVNY